MLAGVATFPKKKKKKAFNSRVKHNDTGGIKIAVTVGEVQGILFRLGEVNEKRVENI